MIRVDLKTHECGPEGLPADLQGLAAESLRDLSWSDPALGYHGCGYWPIREARPELAFGQAYGDPTFVVDADTGVVHRRWHAVPLSGEARAQVLAQRLEQMVRQIDAERDARIARGKLHVFPDGTTGTVQLRHERDTVNVNAVATAGTALMAAGSPDTVAFRDAEDVTHTLTGSDAVQFGLAVMQWVSSHYAAAWAHKDAIRTLAHDADLEALANYDLQTGWPQASAEEVTP